MVDFPAGIAVTRTAFTVISWNVWFDEFEFESRAKSIFAKCRELDADVICFQEVLPEFLVLLKAEPWIKSYKLSSDAFEWSIPPYGVMILAKSLLRPKFAVHMMNSVMDRKFVCAELKLRSRDIFIGTAHLESLKFKDLRREQLVQIASILKEHENSIFVGDFNFCSYRNFIEGGELENNVLQEVLPDHVDMWPAFWDTDEIKGYTYDSAMNPMITHEERMRYDRVLYSFYRAAPTSDASPEATAAAAAKSTWWPQSINLIGTKPIRQVPNEQRNSRDLSRTSFGALAVPLDCSSPLRAEASDITAVLPSDHFGLYASFELHSYSNQDSTGVPGSEDSNSKCVMS